MYTSGLCSSYFTLIKRSWRRNGWFCVIFFLFIIIVVKCLSVADLYVGLGNKQMQFMNLKVIIFFSHVCVLDWFLFQTVVMITFNFTNHWSKVFILNRQHFYIFRNIWTDFWSLRKLYFKKNLSEIGNKKKTYKLLMAF